MTDAGLPPAAQERLRRWRLVLGGDGDTGAELAGADLARDRILAALYGGGTGDGADGQDERGRGGADRRGGLRASAPTVARWLGDIRTWFPTGVVQVLQRDAVERLGLQQLLAEPELLDAVVPDVHLAATLLALGDALPDASRAAARRIVRQVVDELEQRLADPLRRAVSGALDRSARSRRPRTAAEVDWDRTIRANLVRYQPDLGTVIPERLVGYARRRRALERDIVVALDSSASMATSVVHAGVCASVLAGVRALRTRLVVFDTSVVDLTDALSDPVDVLLGVQLGGGTDIGRALRYCASLVTRPRDTVLVLISDLFEGPDPGPLLRLVARLVDDGVVVVALLALGDEGAPAYDHAVAGALAALGVPAFACTPDRFPDLMAAAIAGRDLDAWAARAGVPTALPAGRRR